MQYIAKQPIETVGGVVCQNGNRTRKRCSIVDKYLDNMKLMKNPITILVRLPQVYSRIQSALSGLATNGELTGRISRSRSRDSSTISTPFTDRTRLHEEVT